MTTTRYILTERSEYDPGRGHSDTNPLAGVFAKGATNIGRRPSVRRVLQPITEARGAPSSPRLADYLARGFGGMIFLRIRAALFIF